MWDQRYAEEEYAYGTEPNDFLASVAERMPDTLSLQWTSHRWAWSAQKASRRRAVLQVLGRKPPQL